MAKHPALTLAPLPYHWSAERRRDFYFRIADEAPVDVVYLGEVVCSKREPFFAPYEQAVIERLEGAGKQVVLSTLALIALPREVEALREKACGSRMIEANDVAALQLTAGRPFVVGPFINVMNEGTFAYLVAQGARRIVFASELSGQAIAMLVCEGGGAVQTEVQVFGRQPVAVSMRCYHARAQGRDKDHCRFACGEDPEGLPVDTIAGQPLLTVNGTQTLTRGTLVLLEEMSEMKTVGVTHFRLAPQDCDMVRVVRLYRDVLDGNQGGESALNAMKDIVKQEDWINGFYHGQAGRNFLVTNEKHCKKHGKENRGR